MSNKGLEVFEVNKEAIRFDLEESVKVINAKLDPAWIKTKKQGKADLSYIGGHTVIRLLNKAFNMQWSFEIISEEVVPSLPKPVFDGWGNQRKPRLDAQGNQVMEAQPPVVKIYGRLTVPGVGVREQYGSQVLVGGATEQESGFKAAATDALKKCASLFGIGLELYGEDEGMNEDEHAHQPAPQPTQKPAPKQVQQPVQQPVQEPAQQAVQHAAQQAVPQPTPQPQQTAGAQTSSGGFGEWRQEDITRLKELKAIMGFQDNQELNPYVKELFDNDSATWEHITPSNIQTFNVFLAKKAESL